MTRKTILWRALALFGLGLVGMDAFGQAPASHSAATNPTEQAATAAKNFLAALDESQRGKVLFDFKDSAQRKRWSNLPTTMVKRAGLRMGDLTRPQREAALAVLAAALS